MSRYFFSFFVKQIQFLLIEINFFPTETELSVGLNLEFLSTSNSSQPRIPLNLEFLSTSNSSQPRMVYIQCVKVYIYQKNGFKKRRHQSISVKEGYQSLNIPGCSGESLVNVLNLIARTICYSRIQPGSQILGFRYSIIIHQFLLSI
jgi:hypothetical protein